MLAIGIVAGRTYQIHANPGPADRREDAAFDQITINELKCDHEPLARVLHQLGRKSVVGIILDSKTIESTGTTRV